MIHLWSLSSQYILLLIGIKVVLINEIDDSVNVLVVLRLKILIVKQTLYMATILTNCNDGK